MLANHKETFPSIFFQRTLIPSYPGFLRRWRKTGRCLSRCSRRCSRYGFSPSSPLWSFFSSRQGACASPVGHTGCACLRPRNAHGDVLGRLVAPKNALEALAADGMPKSPRKLQCDALGRLAAPQSIRQRARGAFVGARGAGPALLGGLATGEMRGLGCVAAGAGLFRGPGRRGCFLTVCCAVTTRTAGQGGPGVPPWCIEGDIAP